MVRPRHCSVLKVQALQHSELTFVAVATVVGQYPKSVSASAAVL